MTRLPHSWSAAGVTPPRDIDALVSPRELQVSVEQHDTLLEVQRDLRVGRRATLKTALVRLDLLDDLDRVNADTGAGLRDLVDDTGGEA